MGVNWHFAQLNGLGFRLPTTALRDRKEQHLAGGKAYLSASHLEGTLRTYGASRQEPHAARCAFTGSATLSSFRSMMPALPPAGCPVTNILHDLNHSPLCRDAILGKEYVRRCPFRLRVVLREDRHLPSPAPRRRRMGQERKSGVLIYDPRPQVFPHSGEQDTTYLCKIRLAVIIPDPVTIPLVLRPPRCKASFPTGNGESRHHQLHV